MSKNHSETAIIRIHCPDQRGIVARVTDFIHRNNGNIVALDQHTDRDEERFFMRVEWELQNFELERDQIEPAFEFAIATPCKMKWKLHFSDHIPRMALFVSKMSHCLYDLLARYQSGEMRVDTPLIIGYRKDRESTAASLGGPCVHIPSAAKPKPAKEAKEQGLLKKHGIDWIV